MNKFEILQHLHQAEVGLMEMAHVRLKKSGLLDRQTQELQSSVSDIRTVIRRVEALP